jgi:dihydrodipicolinate synthase/N-acetylneuraminate lyase
MSNSIFAACCREEFAKADSIRNAFLPHEDLRDAWSPAKVLHYATALCGVAETGPVPPFLSSLSEDQLRQLTPVARTLAEQDKSEHS